mmetsp:Transcript_14971/g.28346  ORF Transcript_14971/g.28346 Transcript_14971/m.28346 type:complete len:268 (+) Transcript_14971:852-1655(+)
MRIVRCRWWWWRRWMSHALVAARRCRRVRHGFSGMVLRIKGRFCHNRWVVGRTFRSRAGSVTIVVITLSLGVGTITTRTIIAHAGRLIRRSTRTAHGRSRRVMIVIRRRHVPRSRVLRRAVTWVSVVGRNYIHVLGCPIRRVTYVRAVMWGTVIPVFIERSRRVVGRNRVRALVVLMRRWWRVSVSPGARRRSIVRVWRWRGTVGRVSLRTNSSRTNCLGMTEDILVRSLTRPGRWFHHLRVRLIPEDNLNPFVIFSSRFFLHYSRR